MSQKPPAYLSETAAAWWRRVWNRWQIGVHQRPLLDAAASCLDRIAEAQRILHDEGLVTHDRFGQAKGHPACLIERDSKALFARLFRELALGPEDVPEAARPPRLRGRYQGRD
jgi:phage terminase small subunit